MAKKQMEDAIIPMELLVDVSKHFKAASENKMDYIKIDQLSAKMEANITASTEQTEQLKEAIEVARKPVQNELLHKIDPISKGGITLFTVMSIALMVLSSALYFESRPNYDQRDNDLKYRYIKMKGEATPSMISELEDMFELNRNNAKIRQMQKDVEIFEEAVRKKALLDEQTRLQSLESEKLGKQANEVKQK